MSLVPVTEAPTTLPPTTEAPVTVAEVHEHEHSHTDLIEEEVVIEEVVVDACGGCAFGMTCSADLECVLSKFSQPIRAFYYFCILAVKSRTAFGIIFGATGILAFLLILFLVILPRQKAKAVGPL